MQGYDALRSSAAWIDLSNRGKIRMTGEDRVRLLHAMATRDIQSLAPGDGCYTFFLNAQGRILGDANVYRFDDSLLLDTEPETAAKLFQHLDKFIIADDVTLTDETSEWFVIGVEGPASEAVLRQLGWSVPSGPLQTAAHGESFVAAASVTGLPGFRLFTPKAAEQTPREALSSSRIPRADPEAANIVRLEHARPRYGEDISERYLVQETGQMQGVTYGKGCYLGQEIVERVRSRAQIHRVLSPLRIAAQIPPSPGTKLSVEGASAGEITSAAYSPALGETVALAYLRVEHIAARPRFTVDGAEPSATAVIP